MAHVVSLRIYLVDSQVLVQFPVVTWGSYLFSYILPILLTDAGEARDFEELFANERHNFKLLHEKVRFFCLRSVFFTVLIVSSGFIKLCLLLINFGWWLQKFIFL